MVPRREASSQHLLARAATSRARRHQGSMRDRFRGNRGLACNAFGCDAHSSTVDQSSTDSRLTRIARRATSAAPMKRPLVVLLALVFGTWFVSPAWADDE